MPRASDPPAAAPGAGCVLVLAAGRGRRMGGPKALMMVAGRAWWVAQQERIAATGRAAAWVVSPEVRAALSGAAGAPAVLIDGDPDAPMFASVLAGARALRSSAPGWVHVLPVDVPAPAGSTLELLERAAGAEGVSVPACAGEDGHPVCLSWRWVEDVLLGSGGSVDRTRLDELVKPERVVVRVCDPSVTVNLNTPGDVEVWTSANRGCGT